MSSSSEYDSEQAAELAHYRNAALEHSLDPERPMLRWLGLELREVLWHTEGDGFGLLQERRPGILRMGRALLPTTVFLAENKTYGPADTHAAPYRSAPIVRAYAMGVDRVPPRLETYSWIPHNSNHIENIRAALENTKMWKDQLDVPDEEALERLQNELARAAAGRHIANIQRLRAPAAEF